MGIIVLAVLFAVKHFIADYLFQLDGSSSKKRLPGWGGIKALLLHSIPHGYFTAILVSTYLGFPSIYLSFRDALRILVFSVTLGLIDFVSHFVIDFTKVKAEKYMQPLWIKENISHNENVDKFFLTVLDQLAHASVYLGLIYWIYTGVG